MRKGRDGEKKRKEKKKRMTFLVATTSLPAVYRPNDDRWNAARSCQKILSGGSQSQGPNARFLIVCRTGVHETLNFFPTSAPKCSLPDLKT